MVSPLPYIEALQRANDSAQQSWAPLQHVADIIMQRRQMKQAQGQFDAEQARMRQVHEDTVGLQQAQMLQSDEHFHSQQAQTERMAQAQLEAERRNKAAGLAGEIGKAASEGNQAAVQGLAPQAKMMGLDVGAPPPQVTMPQAPPTPMQPPAPQMQYRPMKPRGISAGMGLRAPTAQPLPPQPTETPAAPGVSLSYGGGAPQTINYGSSEPDIDATLGFSRGSSDPEIIEAKADYVRKMAPLIGRSKALENAEKIGDSYMNRNHADERARAMAVTRGDAAGARAGIQQDKTEINERHRAVDSVVKNARVAPLDEAIQSMKNIVAMTHDKNPVSQMRAKGEFIKATIKGVASDRDMADLMNSMSGWEELQAKLNRWEGDPGLGDDFLADLADSAQSMLDRMVERKSQLASHVWNNVIDNPNIRPENRQIHAEQAVREFLGVSGGSKRELKKGNEGGNSSSSGGRTSVSARGSATRDVLPPVPDASGESLGVTTGKVPPIPVNPNEAAKRLLGEK